MQCPQCQQENPSQAKFCLACGACGTELPATAKFCFACGALIQLPAAI